MKTIYKHQLFQGFQLSSAKNSEGHYEEILQGIYSLLIYMTQKFKSIFVVNMIVKYPFGSVYEHSNDLFLDLLENFSDHCRDKHYHPKYLWVRERSLNTGQFHFHVIYCFNSNFIQKGYGLESEVKRLWGNCLNIKNPKGLAHVWIPKPKENVKNHDNEMDVKQLYRYGGIKLRRSDPEFDVKFALVFKYATYLAKVFSKGYSPYKVNEYGLSNLD